ncbi:MAG: hypothetical protein AAFX06_20000 [Planctomycetota bacterium]
MNETLPRTVVDVDYAVDEETVAHPARDSLKVSRFDSVTSAILALMMFLAAFVFMMFVTWLLSGEPSRLVQQMPIADKAGPTPAKGPVLEFEEPSADEIEELVEHSIEDTIHAVSDAVSTVAATEAHDSTGESDRQAGSTGGDDSPVPAWHGEESVVPRWERWELKFNARGKDEYARQLDFHGIELAAIGGGGPSVIEIASSLSSNPQRKVNDRPETEKRLYFSWRVYTPLIQFDRQLLSAAGISWKGRNVVRFVSPKLEKELAILEYEHCQRNGKAFPGSIAKTLFESQRTESGFEFKVIRQRYR